MTRGLWVFGRRVGYGLAAARARASKNPLGHAWHPVNRGSSRPALLRDSARCESSARRAVKALGMCHNRETSLTRSRFQYGALDLRRARALAESGCAPRPIGSTPCGPKVLLVK